MPTNGEWLPCPFCGCTEIGWSVRDHQDREGTPVAAVCEGCGAIGPWVYSDPVDFARDALAQWNHRTGAETEPKPEGVNDA